MNVQTAPLDIFCGDKQAELGAKLEDLSPPPSEPKEALAWLRSSGLLAYLGDGHGREDSGQNDVIPRASGQSSVMGAEGVARESGGSSKERTVPVVQANRNRLSVRNLCMIRQWLGFHNSYLDGVFAVQGLAVFALAQGGGGSPVHQALLSGTAIGAFALTEPEAGSDIASITTQATLTGEHYELSGTKTLISNADIADYYVVFAKDNQHPQGKVSAFLVDAKAEGLTVQPQQVGSHHILGTITFRGVKAVARIGDPGKGLSIALSTLGTFRASVGAAAVGMATQAFCLAKDHVTSRSQFGNTLSTKQLVQAKMADMASSIEAAKLLVWKAAYLLDTQKGRHSMSVAMAKWRSTEWAQTVIDNAVQLLGGQGVVVGNIVESLYRDIRPLRIYEGTSEIQQLIIAEAALRQEPV